MTQEEIEKIKFDKKIFLQKSKEIQQTNDLYQKRKEITEEYKILQSKLDQYGVSSIQGNGIIISLFSGILAFATQKDYQDYTYINLILSSLSGYFFYFQVMNHQAKNIFQKRLAEIEWALNANLIFLDKIKSYSITEISKKISIKYVFIDAYKGFEFSTFYKNAIYAKLAAIPLVAYFFFNLNFDSFVKKDQYESDQNKTIQVYITDEHCNNDKNKTKANTYMNYINNTNKNNYMMNNNMKNTMNNNMKNTMNNNMKNTMNNNRIDLNNSTQITKENQKIDIEEINNFIHLQNVFLNKLEQCYDCNTSIKKKE